MLEPHPCSGGTGPAKGGLRTGKHWVCKARGNARTRGEQQGSCGVTLGPFNQAAQSHKESQQKEAKGPWWGCPGAEERSLSHNLE